MTSRVRGTHLYVNAHFQTVIFPLKHHARANICGENVKFGIEGNFSLESVDSFLKE
jgi:hypothetical protein